MMQRNDQTLKSIKGYQLEKKRLRTEPDDINCNSNILSDSNSRNSVIRKGLNTSSIHHWVNRKRRIATAQKSRNNENSWIF